MERTCSDRGVLKTRSLPYRSCKPTVHLKTPPNATSSPNKQALQRLKKLQEYGKVAFQFDTLKMLTNMLGRNPSGTRATMVICALHL